MTYVIPRKCKGTVSDVSGVHAGMKMSKADEGRLIHIAKKRERAKEAIEQRRRKLEEETKNRKVSSFLKSGITTKFTANYDAIEDSLKTSTVGLVTLDEMREKQRDVVEARELQKAIEGYSKEGIRTAANDNKGCQKRVLSFAFDDEDEEDMASVPLEKKRVGMDPTVETAFLPDRNREKELARLKEDLAKEWQALQEKEKNEEINIAFVYWDGSSHRKDLKMKKGNTISQFLVRALELLKREFSETRAAVPESLMFVKEDLIIPHFYTFQDFIVTKAMGKTGPLYEFDAAGEIRLRQDAAVDCGESHPAKVVLRSWYEKNKHIYPASRWEAFVPNKEYRRTIDDLTTI
uniref:Protein FAM50 homolog n=1 Tax=Elaeophora elaphi TaxID=1147741 RepID=A0A0R3RFH1_9BILA